MKKTKQKPATTAVKKRKEKTSKKSNKGILNQIKDLLDDPILFNRFDNHIMGYDIENDSIIYDGDGIINELTDEWMQRDRLAGEMDGDWSDYYDRALEFVSGSLPGSVQQSAFRKGKWVDLTENHPKPKIMMRFIQ
jgi:hypothetical protein